MARYNVNFELSVEDMELIEDALLRSKTELSSRDIEVPQAANDTPDAIPSAKARRIHDLLGRLHNQKVFYRPKSSPYVGG